LKNYDEAEKWLSISISLLSFFANKEVYEEQVMNIYNATLKNIQQVRHTSVAL
jgi:hypothetical protein